MVFGYFLNNLNKGIRFRDWVIEYVKDLYRKYNIRMLYLLIFYIFFYFY